MLWWNPLLILISSLMMIKLIKCDHDLSIFDSDDHIFNEIVGGSPTEPSNYPYIVTIQSFGNSHFCGGSLLRIDYEPVVLTAAHCPVSPHFDVVRLYARDADAPFSYHTNNYIDATITRIVEHPDYNHFTYDSDIMLLFLDGYVDYNHQTRPLSSFSFLQTVEIQPNQVSAAGGTECCHHGEDLQVIGYGNDCSNCPNTPTLEYVDVGYLSRSQCNQYLHGRVTNTMNCAGEMPHGGSDSCQGDSGGPLIISGTNIQIGVVSWGYGCAGAGAPGVYADVGVFYDWIQMHLYQKNEQNEQKDDPDEKELNLKVDGSEKTESLSGDNYLVLVVLMAVFVVMFVGGIWGCYKNGCIFNNYSKDNQYQPILGNDQI